MPLLDLKLWRVAFAIYVLTLLVLTHWPRLNPPGVEAGSDKLAHFLAYALWTGLAIGAGLFGPRTSRRNLLTATAVALVWSALDETSQLIPIFERHFSLLDMAANLAGVAAASALAMMVIRPAPEEPAPER